MVGSRFGEEIWRDNRVSQKCAMVEMVRGPSMFMLSLSQHSYHWQAAVQPLTLFPWPLSVAIELVVTNRIALSTDRASGLKDSESLN